MSAIAGVQARVAAIRGRLNESRSSAGSTQTVPGTPGFDPFGAAYQAALGGATAGSAVPSQQVDAPTLATDMTTAKRVRSIGSGTRTGSESSSTRSTALSGVEIANLAYNAGFRGQDLVNVVAISKRESNWTPSAYNGNAGTGDASYGLMQINMLGDLGPARLAEFGLSSYDQLLDPQTNMDAAFTIYTRAGGTLHAWGGYKGLSDTFGTDLAAAEQVVRDAHLDG